MTVLKLREATEGLRMLGFFVTIEIIIQYRLPAFVVFVVVYSIIFLHFYKMITSLHAQSTFYFIKNNL